MLFTIIYTLSLSLSWIYLISFNTGKGSFLSTRDRLSMPFASRAEGEMSSSCGLFCLPRDIQVSERITPEVTSIHSAACPPMRTSAVRHVNRTEERSMALFNIPGFHSRRRIDLSLIRFTFKRQRNRSTTINSGVSILKRMGKISVQAPKPFDHAG